MSEATAAPKLKAHVEELSGKITPALVLNKTEGSIAPKEGSDPYLDNLPATLTPELVEAKDGYDTAFYAASAHAVGVMATDALKKHAKLDVITAELPMGKHNSVNHELTRAKTYNNIGGDREPVTKHAVLRTEIDIRGGRTDSGPLKQVRTLIADLGEKILAGDKAAK